MRSDARSRLLADHGSVAPEVRGIARSRLALAHVAWGMGRSRVLILAGTRPECIKLAPLIVALRGIPALAVLVVNSGQHRAAVRATLDEFGLAADIELPALGAFANLATRHRHLSAAIAELLKCAAPDLLIVQGDTLTAYGGARAGQLARCRVAHVEAGLRTDSIAEPFPEEWFRRRIAPHAFLHFTPSASATQQLLAEGVDGDSIHQTGNTGIDSLRDVLQGPTGDALRYDGARNAVLVTLHRRSNHDQNAALVCDALADLVSLRRDLRVVFPVHPNPRVSDPIRRRLGSHAAFDLVAPMRYREFIETAARAALIVSDSGGIQEEAPHLGTPLLVPRVNTERPESVDTGFVRLVPVERGAIVRAAIDALHAPRRPPLPIDELAPFGAGDAADRIAQVIERALHRRAAA